MPSDRRWLEDDKESASYVLWTAATTGDGAEFIDASVKIGDCNRVVTLNFDGYSENAKEESLRKAKRLLAAVRAFVGALEAAVEESGDADAS